ncbi:AMP-binding protein [Pseudoroseomonas wenyumeiae]
MPERHAGPAGRQPGTHTDPAGGGTPLLWLELIARHRAAISWAPNFAFSLINNAAEELQRAALDLSCLRFLVNAGEQVTARTALDFLTLLAPYGVPQDVLRPAFGMSETCSGITWSAGLTPACLAQEGSYVSLGRPIPGAEIRITCEDGAVLAEGRSVGWNCAVHQSSPATTRTLPPMRKPSPMMAGSAAAISASSVTASCT